MSKIGTFGGFSEERIQSLLEVIWNKVEYYLKDPQKAAGQLEDCSDSKLTQSVLNGRTFKYHFLGGGFHMFPQSCKCSYILCLNNFTKVWFIGNQRDQVPPVRYIN